MRILRLCKHRVVSMVLAGLSILLVSCYADQGSSTQSKVDGFNQYSNRTLNIAVLSPSAWQGNVGINGMYTLTAPTEHGTRTQIYVNSRPIEELLAEVGGTRDSTLEDYQAYYLSHEMTEDVKGPELEYKVEKTTLAGRDARQVRYSFKGTDGLKWFVREVFTVADGKVYFLRIYSSKPDIPAQRKVFEAMKDSFRIL